MEVEDEALLDEEDASNNDPTSDATETMQPVMKVIELIIISHPINLLSL